MKLGKATPCIPSTMIPLHHTGMPKSLIGERSGSDGQSVYCCKFETCAYLTAQYAQCCMHIHRKHLGVCVKCRLCDKRSYQMVDLQKHLTAVHPNEESDWFESIPALEGDVVEVSEETLRQNIALIKVEPTPNEDDDEED